MLMVLTCTVSSSLQAAETKNSERSILVLFSEGADKPLYAEYLRFFAEKIHPSVDQIVYEFLNSQISSESHYSPLSNLTPSRYEYDVVVAIGNEALRYATQAKNRFQHSPILFTEVDSTLLANSVANTKQARGQFSQSSVVETLTLAQKFRPKAKSIYITFDSNQLNTNQYQHLLSEIDTSIAANKEVTFIDTAILTVNEFSKRLTPLNKDHILVISNADLRFLDRQYIAIAEIKALLQTFDLPIFTTNQTLINESISGGVTTERSLQQNDLEQKILRILGGDRIDKLEALWNTPKTPKINARALKQYRVSKQQLPEDTEYYNESTIFIEENIPLIRMGTLFLIIIATVLIYLIIQVRLRTSAERNLSNEKFRLQSLLDNIPDPIYYLNEKGELNGGNRALIQAFGNQNCIASADLSESDNIICNSDDVVALSTGQRKQSSGWVQFLDGSNHYLDVIKAPYKNPDGDMSGVIGIARDISQYHLREQNLKRLAKIFRHAAECMLMTDENGLITDANRAFFRLTGFYDSEIQLKTLFDLLPDREQAVLKSVLKTLGPNDTWQGEMTLRLKDERTIHTGFTVSTVSDAEAQSLSYVCGFIDISELKRTQNELKRLAHYDSLTGLANRTLLNTKLSWLIEESQRKQQQFAVVFIDVDNFKHINDSLGHEFGDKVLKVFAKTLEHQIRPCDVAARLGGDEFVLLLSSVKSERQVDAIARKYLNALSTPINIDSHAFQMQCSLGISLYPYHGETVDELIKHADSAMYAAKNSGKNTYSVYNPSLTKRVFERLKLEQEIKVAFAKNHFQLYYQPVIGLHSGVPEKAEALIRWPLANGKFLPPDKFIPVAEETGVIIPIGLWVIEQACRAMVEWQQAGLSIKSVAVNVSKVQIVRDNLFHQLKDILLKTGCKPEWLGLEVTESTIMEMDNSALDQLHSIKSLGVNILIDDFGTGHSSLSMLKTLPITYLKVDRSFIMNTPADNQDVEITRLIVNLGHMLEVSLIAEGIETLEQKNMLQSMGCHYGQGYLFSPPVPNNAFKAYCENLSLEHQQDTGS